MDVRRLLSKLKKKLEHPGSEHKSDRKDLALVGRGRDRLGTGPQFGGSLRSGQLKTKEGPSAVVGGIVGAVHDEVPARQVVCSWGISQGSSWLDCEGGEGHQCRQL